MKLKFYRVQTVEVELTRKPTSDEIKILKGQDDEKTMFDLEGLVNFDTEDVIDEDYSNDVTHYISFNEIISNL